MKKIKKIKSSVKKKIIQKKSSTKKPKPIGKITHYFSNINVAVVKVLSPIKVGDEIRIVGGESTDFTQKIVSMQADHKEIKKAKKGQSVGMKVSQRAREGYYLYKA